MKKKYILTLIIALPALLMLVSLWLISRNSEIANEKRRIVAACEEYRKSLPARGLEYKDSANYSSIELSPDGAKATVYFHLYKYYAESGQKNTEILSMVAVCEKGNAQWNITESRTSPVSPR